MTKNNSLMQSLIQIKQTILEQLSNLGDIVTYICITAIIFFVNPHLCLQLATSLAIITIVASIIKLYYKKERPVKEVRDSFFTTITASSFPSVHVMRITSLAILCSINMNNIIVIILFAFFVIGVALSRITLKKHDFTDVFGGFMISTILTFLILWLMP